MSDEDSNIRFGVVGTGRIAASRRRLRSTDHVEVMQAARMNGPSGMQISMESHPQSRPIRGC